MKAWLTKGFDNRYLLTYFKPIVERIYGTKKHAVYLEVGEPIGIMGLCEDGIRMVFPDIQLESGESVKVELLGSINE